MVSRIIRLTRRFGWLMSWVGLMGMLSACQFPAPAGARPTTPAPQALFTAAAQTAEALRLERFGQTPTPAPALLVASIAVPSPTVEESPTVLPTPSATAPATIVARSGADGASFIEDVTVPDGTVFAPGETFEKIWRISNTGQSTWTTDYALIYIDGEMMGAPTTVPIPKEVKPGEQADVAVAMIAPQTPGNYISYWKMTNAERKIFGFGASGNEAIWVKITVQGSSALATAATATATPSSAITSVTLSVDQPTFTGDCPHTFIFTAQLTLNKAASVTYLLEAGDLTGGEVILPSPITRNLLPGVHPIVYELTFPGDVSGWVRLRFTKPVELLSNQVDFSLTCG